MPADLRTPIVVSTRLEAPDGPMHRAMRAARVTLVSAPVTATRDVPGAADALARRLEDPCDWVAVTSGRAARVLAEALRRASRRRRAPAVRIAAVGPGTAACLRARGVPVHTVAPVPSAAALAGHLIAQSRGVRPLRVIWPRACSPTRSLAAGLRAAGARVTEIAVYETVLRSGDAPSSLDHVLRSSPRVAAVCFFAPSAVRAAAELAPESRVRLDGIVTAGFGPRTRAALDAAGWRRHPDTGDADIVRFAAAIADVGRERWVRR